MTGNKTITITPQGEAQPEFPRGELLSVGSDGSHNYAMDPVRVLAWIRDQNVKALEGKVNTAKLDELIAATALGSHPAAPAARRSAGQAGACGSSASSSCIVGSARLPGHHIRLDLVQRGPHALDQSRSATARAWYAGLGSLT